MVTVAVQVRTLPRKAMDEVHQHPAIQIFQLKLLRKKATTNTAAPASDSVGTTDQPAVPGPAPAEDDNSNASAIARTTDAPAVPGPATCRG